MSLHQTTFAQVCVVIAVLDFFVPSINKVAGMDGPMQALVRLITCSLMVLTLDALFIGVVMRDRYVRMISDVQKESLRLRFVPAVFASFLVAFGLWAITLSDGQPWNAQAQKNAAIFGLSCFGIYNLTNLATFSRWSPVNSAVDVTYGTCLCVAAYATTSLILP